MFAQNASAEAAGGDRDARDRGAHDPARLNWAELSAIGIPDRLPVDDRRDDRLERRQAERAGAAGKKRDQQDVPEGDRSRRREDREAGGQRRTGQLGGNEQSPAIDPIRQDAGEQRQQEHRGGLDGAVTPSRPGESVRSRTSQPWAVVCIHDPSVPMNAPTRNRR